jgi:hypothetical protein
MTVERSRPRLRVLPITAMTCDVGDHGDQARFARPYPSPHPSTRIPKDLQRVIPRYPNLAWVETLWGWFFRLTANCQWLIASFSKIIVPPPGQPGVPIKLFIAICVLYRNLFAFVKENLRRFCPWLWQGMNKVNRSVEGSRANFPCPCRFKAFSPERFSHAVSGKRHITRAWLPPGGPSFRAVCERVGFDSVFLLRFDPRNKCQGLTSVRP